MPVHNRHRLSRVAISVKNQIDVIRIRPPGHALLAVCWHALYTLPEVPDRVDIVDAEGADDLMVGD